MAAYCYSVYGVTLESEIPFPGLTRPRSRESRGQERILLRIRDFPPIPRRGWFRAIGLRFWISRDRRQAMMHASEAGCYRIHFREKIVEWKTTRRNPPAFAHSLLRERVMGLLLSRFPSVVLLHGNVVAVNGEGILLCGPGGAGKSTLTACFLNGGFSLLTDDMAVIRKKGEGYLVERGAPEIRLWPVTASFLKPCEMEGKLLWPGSRKQRFSLNGRSHWRFSENPVVLRKIYFLSRKAGGRVHLQELARHEAMTKLLGQGYTPLLDSEARRNHFQTVLELTAKIPVKRLSYPSGWARLDRAREAILRDFESHG